MGKSLLTQLFRSSLALGTAALLTASVWAQQVSLVLGCMVSAGFVALLALLLVGLPAPAADYILSDGSSTLPTGVTVVSPGKYSCGVLTLGAGDTISLGARALT